jgi:hypothetical protein
VGSKIRRNCGLATHLGIQLADVRQTYEVRAGGTGRRRTMNELRNGASAKQDGFHAVSTEELDRIAGGEASMSWYRGSTVGEAIQSFVNEATARYRALKEQYG